MWSPPFAREALLAAGVVPPLVALLGRWPSLKATGPGGKSDSERRDARGVIALELMWYVGGLVMPSPCGDGPVLKAQVCRPVLGQLRAAGASRLLQALADDPELQPGACSEGRLVAALCESILPYLGT